MPAPLDGPTVLVRNYIDFARHGEFPKVEPSRPRPVLLSQHDHRLSKFVVGRQRASQANQLVSSRRIPLRCLAGQQCIRTCAKLQMVGLVPQNAIIFDRTHTVVRRSHKRTERMSQTGPGRRPQARYASAEPSLREIGQLSSVHHAYVHRLESGEKTNPSVGLSREAAEGSQNQVKEMLRW